MNNLLKLAGISCAIFVILAQATAAQERQMTVVGEGHIAVQPDMASVQIGVEVSDETARAALDEMSAVQEGVIERLLAEGVDAAQIRTEGLMVNRQYHDNSFSGASPSGFYASSTLQVSVLDIEALGAVLDAVVEDGANIIHGIRFDLRDQSEVLTEARRLAVADAIAKAQLYADAAGITLGDVLQITEITAASAGPMYDMAARMEAPIAPGQMGITARVTLIVEITP